MRTQRTRAHARTRAAAARSSSDTHTERRTLVVTDEFLAVGGGPAFLVPSTKRNSGAAAGTSHASFPQFSTVSTGSMKAMENPKPKQVLRFVSCVSKPTHQ